MLKLGRVTGSLAEPWLQQTAPALHSEHPSWTSNIRSYFTKSALHCTVSIQVEHPTFTPTSLMYTYTGNALCTISSAYAHFVHIFAHISHTHTHQNPLSHTHSTVCTALCTCYKHTFLIHLPTQTQYHTLTHYNGMAPKENKTLYIHHVVFEWPFYAEEHNFVYMHM
jgi:hypothetical protein